VSPSQDQTARTAVKAIASIAGVPVETLANLALSVGTAATDVVQSLADVTGLAWKPGWTGSPYQEIQAALPGGIATFGPGDVVREAPSPYFDRKSTALRDL
jgi:hypothetical protein